MQADNNLTAKAYQTHAHKGLQSTPAVFALFPAAALDPRLLRSAPQLAASWPAADKPSHRTARW